MYWQPPMSANPWGMLGRRSRMRFHPILLACTVNYYCSVRRLSQHRSRTIKLRPASGKWPTRRWRALSVNTLHQRQGTQAYWPKYSRTRASIFTTKHPIGLWWHHRRRARRDQAQPRHSEGHPWALRQYLTRQRDTASPIRADPSVQQHGKGQGSEGYSIASSKPSALCQARRNQKRTRNRQFASWPSQSS